MKKLKDLVAQIQEDQMLDTYLSSRGINPKFVSTITRISKAKSGDFSKWKRDHWDMIDTQNRQKALAKEEVEQIDELSKDTLKSYAKKASGSSHENSALNLSSRAAYKLANDQNSDDDGEKDDKKAFKRAQGVSKAIDRLTKEETIDEVHGQPVGKLMADIQTKQDVLDFMKNGGKVKTVQAKAPTKAQRLRMHLGKTPKLNREEIEPIDEIKKETLTSYYNKANAEMGDKFGTDKWDEKKGKVRATGMERATDRLIPHISAKLKKQDIKNEEMELDEEGKATYRKNNDHRCNSSTYHKKDGTNVRGKIKDDTKKQVKELEKGVKEEVDLEEAKRPDRPPPKTDLKVDDRVVADVRKEKNYPGGHQYRSGFVTRIGEKGVHIKPDDGGEHEWHPYNIVKKLGESFEDEHGIGGRTSKKKSALDKFRKASADRAKKHDDIQNKASGDSKGAIDRLEKHLNKEEVEPIQEISHDALVNYQAAAKKDIVKRVHGDSEYLGDPKLSNRLKGFNKARRKEYVKGTQYNVPKPHKPEAPAKEPVDVSVGMMRRSLALRMRKEDTYQDPQAATQTCFDMGTNPNDTQTKSARIIKALYKHHKMVKEAMVDTEKDEKSVETYGKKPILNKPDDKKVSEKNPPASMILKGGTTLTGETRDTIEIDPVPRNRPGQPDITKDKNDK